MKNVLYITVDSIRADHVGHLGYDRPTTPTLDELAGRGMVCPRTYASGIPTFYAFKTLLGGTYALGHGRDIGMPNQATTLAETFQQGGYATAGFNAGNPWLTREYGYDRGFETFRDFLSNEEGDPGLGKRLTSLLRSVQPYVESSDLLGDKLGYATRTAFVLAGHTPIEFAETVTDVAIEWLRGRNRQRPFFLWIHYMDPHYPWVPCEGDVERFSDESLSKADVGRLWHAVSTSDGDGQLDLSSSDLASIRDLYDAEIRRTDDAIARLLDALEKTGADENTVVSVVGDHGTELGDHGSFSHGPRTLYDEVVHVPLVFAGPDIADNRQTGVTSMLDVPTSVMDAAGLEYDAEEFVGRSVFEETRESAVIEVVYDYEPRSVESSENGLLRACVEWPWKLVINDHLGTEKLYHLPEDPHEQSNLAASNPDVVADLRERLVATRDDVERWNATMAEKARVRRRIATLRERGRI